MAITKTSKNFKNKGKDIKYLNKDFGAFRGNLIEFAKTYFPQTYSDFNESSPGMMFIEMASYVGDSLSYYVDDTLKESLITKLRDDLDENSRKMQLQRKAEEATAMTTHLDQVPLPIYIA